MATQYERGYRAALLEVAELAIGEKTRDASLLLIEDLLEQHGIVRDWIGS